MWPPQPLILRLVCTIQLDLNFKQQWRKMLPRRPNLGEIFWVNNQLFRAWLYTQSIEGNTRCIIFPQVIPAPGSWISCFLNWRKKWGMREAYRTGRRYGGNKAQTVDMTKRNKRKRREPREWLILAWPFIELTSYIPIQRMLLIQITMKTTTQT